MKKLYSFASAIVLALIISLLLPSSALMAQNQETFPNDYNISFTTGVLVPSTFEGDLGTWTASSSGNWATIVSTNAHPRNILGPGEYALKMVTWRNDIPEPSVATAMSPVINFSSYAGNPGSPLVEFWIYPFEAYAGITCATFSVQFSSNAGATWTTVYTKTSSDLLSQFNYNSYTGNNIVIPVANVYRTANFRFRFVTGMTGICGEVDQNMHLYIDDIRLITPSAGSLPVNIVSFNAAKNGNSVGLNWKVADESNFNEYVVERGTDGKTFSKVGTVKCNNNGETTKEYKFSDDLSNVSGKAVYYRLKLVDTDGSQKYSSILNVRLANGESRPMSLYPTPAKQQFSVRIDVGADQLTGIRIVNADGRVVKQLQQRLYKGSNTFTVNGISDLPAGIYCVQVVADGEVKTTKLYKQ